MQMEWRRLRPGELDHELVWLLVTVAAAAWAACWLSLQLPWPGCGWRALTGLPCVTCGATRAAQALLQGDVLSALRFNPLITAALGGIGVYDLYAGVVLLSRARRLRVRFSGGKVRAWVLSILLALGGLNWIYLLRQ